MRSALLLLLLAACTAPNLARDAAVRDANAAVKRGDVVAAAYAYRAGCQAAPTEVAVCKAAAQWAHQAAVKQAALARPACESAPDPARIEACLAALSPARQLLPQDPELVRLANAAGAAQYELCTRNPPRDPGEGIRLMRCLQQIRRYVATPQYEGQMLAGGKLAAARFLDLAALESNRKLPGAEAALWAAAACFDHADEIRRRAETAAIEFVAATRQPVAMTVHGSGPVDPAASATLQTICARAADALGPRVVCAAPGISVTAPPIRIDVDLRLGSPQHQVNEEQRSVRYQDGVNRYDNPAYRTAVDREQQTRAELQRAEAQAHQDESACSSARSAASGHPELEDAARAACDAADGSHRTFESRRSEHEAAQRTLDDTDAIIEEPIYRDYAYTVRRHEWTVHWVARLQLQGGESAEVSDAVAYTDEEAPGFSPAGLADDPLSPPDRDWFEDPIAAGVSQSGSKLIEGELARRVVRRRADCVGATPVWEGHWLQCWTEATLLGGQMPTGSVLIRAAADADGRFGGPAARWPAPECL
jgi:hypothetical protein